MKCSTVKKYLSAYSDNELGEKRAHLVEDHIKTCSTCKSEIARLNATYEFIASTPELDANPYLAARIRAVANSESKQISLMTALHKLLAPALILAGLSVGYILGVQLKNAMQIAQPQLSEHTEPQRHIDNAMFTTMPSGSITASYIALTSAKQ